MSTELGSSLFPVKVAPPPDLGLEPSSVLERRRAAYLKHASRPIAVGGLIAVLLSLAFGSATMALATGLIWVGVSLFLLRSRWLRAAVDENLDQLQKEHDIEIRRDMLASMSDHHRARLEQIEELIDDIRSKETQAERAIAALIESPVDLDLLTTTYARCAIALRELEALLGETHRARLAAEIQGLEEGAENGPASIRPALRRRLGVLRARAAEWDRRQEEASLLSTELDTMEDVVRLLHDLSARSVPGLDPGQVDALLGSLGEIRATTNDLLELDRNAPAIRALENGRVRRRVPRRATRARPREPHEDLW
jgi:hypothetical protein